MKKQTIAIVGGGFGGLRAALDLCKLLKKHNLEKVYEVALIDKRRHHVFTPLLYEVATAPKSQANIKELHDLAVHSFDELIQSPGRFVHGAVTDIDFDARSIELGDGTEIPYAYLLLAPGAEPNYFDIPGLKKHAYSFNDFEHAVEVREELWELAELNDEVRVVVGGGGPTGVELAGEIAMWCKEAGRKHHCNMDIALVDANERVLAPFSKKVSAKAIKRLKKLGITLVLNTRITKLDNERVYLGDDSIPYDLFVWTGGVKASSLAIEIPAKKEQRGQVAVKQTMHCVPRDEHLHAQERVYAIGDSVCVVDPKTGEQVPGVARAAIEQGGVAAQNIVSDILKSEGKKAPKHKEYNPYRYPYIVPIGGKYAIATVGPFVFSGFFAWVFKGLVELNYFLSVVSVWEALRLWLKGLWVFTRNERLG